MHLYKVEMSRGHIFFVAAKNETQAARRAEKRWSDWEYRSDGGYAISVLLAGWSDQYPPSTINGDVAWFLLDGKNQK